jgi:hypothetical protein
MKKKDLVVLNRSEYYSEIEDIKNNAIEETEKSLQLTWEDMELIHDIMKEIKSRHKFKRPFYEEVLSIFNEARNHR